jgi:hypothetical protein
VLLVHCVHFSVSQHSQEGPPLINIFLRCHLGACFETFQNSFTLDVSSGVVRNVFGRMSLLFTALSSWGYTPITGTYG